MPQVPPKMPPRPLQDVQNVSKSAQDVPKLPQELLNAPLSRSTTRILRVLGRFGGTFWEVVLKFFKVVLFFSDVNFLRSVAQRYLRPKLSTRFSLCLINPCPSERFRRSLVEIFLQASRSFCILTSLQIL